MPHNPPQHAPPNTPENPRTNVAVSIPQETLSPTPQVLQTVRSAIEVTAQDFEPSEQPIVDKCGEVDFQLSSYRDWQQPNPRLRQDICDLLP